MIRTRPLQKTIKRLKKNIIFQGKKIHMKNLKRKLPATYSKMNCRNIKKPDKPYLEPTIDDALKNEDEIKNKNDNFLDTAIDFNKVGISAANQKKHNFHSELFDAVADLPPEKIYIDDMSITEDIFINDDLFSNTNKKDEDKQNIDGILQQVNHSDNCTAQPTVEIKEQSRLKPAKKRF